MTVPRDAPSPLPAAVEPPAAPPPLRAHALLLAERLDHRGLARMYVGLADPLPPPVPEGVAAAFAFRWGAVVVVGASAGQEARLLADLRPRLGDPLDEAERTEEAFLLRLAGEAEEEGPVGTPGGGGVALRDLSPARLAVVAEALAKDVALAHAEAAVARTFDRLDPVVDALRRRGTPGVSPRRALRAIGEALAVRGRSAAMVETGGKPELLWHRPDLEALYESLAGELELAERGAALERKLGIAREASEAPLSLVEARRSRGLELAVAALVAAEACSTLYGLFAGGG